MNTQLFKLLTSVLLWAVALVFGLLPLLNRRFNTNKLAISLSQCFAGGLFVAIGLIHILPEARENLEDSWKKDDEEVFPLSYFICLVTFSAILLIDKVLFNNTDIIEGGERPSDLRTSLLRKSILGNKDAEPEENFQEMVSHNMKIALSMSRLNIQEKNRSDDEDDGYEELPSETLPEDLRNLQANGIKGGSSPEKKQVNRITDPSPQKEVLEIPVPKSEVTHDHKHDGHDHKHDGHDHKHEGHDHKHDHKKEHKHDHTPKSHQKHEDAHDHHGHHHATVQKGASYVSAMVILTAMGIHGLFEGLAYGVSKEETEVLNMFLAIAAHKWCDSLVVGISFVAAEIPLRMAIILTVFLSLFTPLGILIGYLASSSTIVTGIFQALSAGTFLYISCAEIIIEEFAISDKKFWKFLCYSAGILFIVVMSYVGHGHSHDHKS